MKIHSVKIYNKKGNITSLDLLGIEEFITDKEDLKFLKKNLNFMIGLWIGRIRATNGRRVEFLNVVNKNSKPKDRYQEVFQKFLVWYSTMEIRTEYSDFISLPKHLCNELQNNKQKKTRSYTNKEIIRSSDSKFDENQKKVPNYILNKMYKESQDHGLSDTYCVKCNEMIPQKRIDIFLQDLGVKVDTCVECAENSSTISKSLDIPNVHPRPPKDKEICPRCGSATWVQQRHSDQKLFLACSTFPKCRWTANFTINA